MKRFIFALMGLGATAMAQGPVSPPSSNLTAVLACKVVTLVPAGANFFSVGPTPRVGDAITLDFSGSTLDEMRFDSGSRIPLKEIGAKLTNSGSTATLVRFRGTHTGTLGQYQGLLLGFINEQNQTASLTFQVLRESQFQGFELHSLQMTCTVTN